MKWGWSTHAEGLLTLHVAEFSKNLRDLFQPLVPPSWDAGYTSRDNDSARSLLGKEFDTTMGPRYGLAYSGAEAHFVFHLNAGPTARRGRLEGRLFHGSANIVMAPIKPAPLTNTEAESFGTKRIPPLRVGMTRSLFFRRL